MRIIFLGMLGLGVLLPSCNRADDRARNARADTGLPTSPSIKSGNAAFEIENVAAPETLSGQQFVNFAAASDNFEVQSSRLALANAHSAAVKSFARQMIGAHTQSTTKLMRTAAALNPPLVPDPTLASDQQQTLDQLRGHEGDDFDRTYITVQIDGHQKTLSALKAYAYKGDQPALNGFAHDMVPIVSRHLAMAHDLQH